PKRSENGMELIGHLAKANPHWRSFSQSQATVVFHGPHTYITPKWYIENDVPTWNYSVVHITGSIELIENYDGIVECLKELTSHTERHWPSGWDFFIPEDLNGENLTKNIVGFRIKIEHIDFKKKLSQNRSAVDRAGILKGLETRTDENSRRVLNEMKK
ncbi:FMN-binding negative transcriptional regulator, partial [bacterium]|nr:FMN-binding negative transcriptional regulator [bacterium]